LKVDWKGVLGLVVSAALLWWALHDIRFGEVWSTLRQSNIPLFLLSAATATAVVPLRALRWRPILDPVAPNLPFGPLWRATAIGVMVNNVVPARVGELTRAYVLTRETPRVSLAAAIASIAVDRLFDGLVVLVLALLAMLSPSFPAGARVGQLSVTRWALIGLAGMVGLMVLLYAIVFFPSWLIGAYELVARRIAPRLEEPGRVALRAFADGLSVLRNGRRFATVFGWALALWLTNALSMWIGFQAVGIPADFSAALFLQGVVALAVAVPSAPGFFGVFEASAIIGLGVYGVPREAAVTWAIGYHILSFIPITSIGLWYFARLGLHLRDLNAGEATEA
jgi:glycosyltransferase 2 family protein